MSVKDVSIKKPNTFLNGIINIKDCDPDNIKIDEKLYKNILIYYIGYVTIKKDLEIYSVNPLYLIFGSVNGHVEEVNRNKYLMLFPTNESKEKTKKYDNGLKFRDLIRLITKSVDDYDEKYMQIKFDSDDNLPLNKTIEIPMKTIVVRAVFQENNKYYPQVFLDECLYKV